MKIPYNSFHELITDYLVHKSLSGIIKDCYNSFDSSIETAKRIEDYLYLDSMITKRELYESKYNFFWDYKNEHPTVIEKNVDLTIDALVIFSFDFYHLIPKSRFTDLIHSIATDRLNIDSSKYLKRFDNLYQLRENLYKLEFEKIGRNEPCPCGSLKKYKNCHGA